MKFTDEYIDEVIKAVGNETEESMKVVHQTILTLLKEIRNYQKKKLCTCSEVHKQPTNNPNDIIVGEAFFGGKIGMLKVTNEGKEYFTGKCKCSVPEAIKLRTAENPDGYDLPVANRKPLKDLTNQEIATLKELGLFWELYPEAGE